MKCLKTALSSLSLLAVLASTGSAHAADRFVVISDSHGVGRFGAEISTWLRARGDAEFELFASGGAAPMQWWNEKYTTPVAYRDYSSSETQKLPSQSLKLFTPNLATIWKRVGHGSAADRRITVIVQGTNIPSERVLESLARKNSRMTMGALKGAEISYSERLVREALAESETCVWVGPPNTIRGPDWNTSATAHKVSIIKQALALNLKKHGKTCTFIDSREFTTYPTGHGDGIHYHLLQNRDKKANDAARAWANGVTSRLEALLDR